MNAAVRLVALLACALVASACSGGPALVAADCIKVAYALTDSFSGFVRSIPAWT
jgi:hypothetical protein